jgi:hypothetical protein
MQTPVRVKIPLPAGTEVTVNGPHYYSTRTWVGRPSDGITPQQAFEALSRHATPFQQGSSINDGTIDIPGFGKVHQLVDPDRLNIVNTTMPGHVFYPGNVHRSIIQDGDNLYVETRGYGTGLFPRLNEFFAPWVWEHEDRKVLDELKQRPESTLSPDGTGSLRTPQPAAPSPPQSSGNPASSPPPLNDDLRDLYRNDPAWLLQNRR